MHTVMLILAAFLALSSPAMVWTSHVVVDLPEDEACADAAYSCKYLDVDLDGDGQVLERVTVQNAYQSFDHTLFVSRRIGKDLRQLRVKTGVGATCGDLPALLIGDRPIWGYRPIGLECANEAASFVLYWDGKQYQRRAPPATRVTASYSETLNVRPMLVEEKWRHKAVFQGVVTVKASGLPPEAFAALDRSPALSLTFTNAQNFEGNDTFHSGIATYSLTNDRNWRPGAAGFMFRQTEDGADQYNEPGTAVVTGSLLRKAGTLRLTVRSSAGLWPNALESNFTSRRAESVTRTVADTVRATLVLGEGGEHPYEVEISGLGRASVKTRDVEKEEEYGTRSLMVGTVQVRASLVSNRDERNTKGQHKPRRQVAP